MNSRTWMDEQGKKSQVADLKITLYAQTPQNYTEVFAKMSGKNAPDFSRTVLGAVLEQERQGNLQQAITKLPGEKIGLIGGFYTSLEGIASKKQLVVKMDF